MGRGVDAGLRNFVAGVKRLDRGLPGLSHFIAPPGNAAPWWLQEDSQNAASPVASAKRFAGIRLEAEQPARVAAGPRQREKLTWVAEHSAASSQNSPSAMSFCRWLLAAVAECWMLQLRHSRCRVANNSSMCSARVRKFTGLMRKYDFPFSSVVEIQKRPSFSMRLTTSA